MTGTRLEFNWDALNLRLLPQLQRVLDAKGREIAEACGEGYEYRPPTRNQVRDRGMITARTAAAKRDNQKHFTLVRKTIEAIE